MRNPVAIEDIEEMRRQEGIDDGELREKIYRLRAGDRVRITILTEPQSGAGKTVMVRITSVRGRAFRGKVIATPGSTSLSDLEAGSRLFFTAAHIHSIPKEPSGREP